MAFNARNVGHWVMLALIAFSVVVVAAVAYSLTQKKTVAATLQEWIPWFPGIDKLS